MTSSGKPTSSLIARMQAAIFAKAYNDDRLLELTADSAKPEIANILNALNTAAPDFVLAAEYNKDEHEKATRDLTTSIKTSLSKQSTNAIIEAINVLNDANNHKMTVEEFINQNDLFGGVSPDVAAMALFIKNNNRSAKRMGVAFKEMADFIKREGEHSQSDDLFGDNNPAEFKDIITAVNRKLEKEYGEGEFLIKNDDLFDLKREPEPTPENAPIDPDATKYNDKELKPPRNKYAESLLKKLKWKRT